MKYRDTHRGLLALIGCMLAIPAFSEDLPSLGEGASPWKTDVFYENHTAYRGHDVGLSKFRNTLQVESDKGLGDGWAFHSVLRGTWDGVYRMNDSKFGDKAGGAVSFQNNQPAGLAGTVPYGSASVPLAFPAGGLVNPLGINAGPGTNGFTPGNTNTGLAILGSGWHGFDGNTTGAVPVRPCDVDSRGCADFGGYGDLKRSELESPEFNSKLDFIREAYAKKTFALKDGSDLFVKVGRQQIVWGRTDLFRVLDVFNPVDYSRNNIYDELQDIRIPLWSAQVEWRMGGSETMQDRNLQFVWSFDQFRANNLGQCGSPNAILDAACLFRALKMLWDNGNTLSNFAGPVGPGTVSIAPGLAGLRNIHLPKWSDAGSFGVKYEGVTQDGLSFSLNALTYRSQLPSLRGAKGNALSPYNPYLLNFDMEFPRLTMVGGSMDLQMESIGAAIRLEGALTHGEEFANTARPELYSKNNTFRSVIGIDRPTFIPFINPNRTTLLSAQLFYQHIYEHQVVGLPTGRVGMPDWEDNVIGTLLIKGFMNNDRVSPQLILARDFQAHAWVASPQLEWSVTNDLKLTFGANVKGRDDNTSRYNWDNTTANGALAGGGLPTGIAGGIEPLGRFRAGPIGTAFNQNDIYFMARYKF
ncbi:MAG: DUF1302 family protein [Rhodocyclaceae bacterium]|nr:MAG: DUF1302 family protein [Rhodocyclaceae bacterium]